MQKLEEELQVSLFDRQKNKLTLKQNGEIAVRYAENVLEEVRRMVHEVRSFDLPSFASDLALRRNPCQSSRVHIPILDPEAHVTYYCLCRAIFPIRRSLDYIAAEFEIV